MKRSHTREAVALKALAAPRRLEILEVLQKGPCSVGEIAEQVDVSQQAVSQHLAVLSRAGLVEAHRQATRNVHMLRPTGFGPLEALMRGFTVSRVARLKSRSTGLGERNDQTYFEIDADRTVA